MLQLQPQLLVTFAALAGNDYVKLQDETTSVLWANSTAERGSRSQRHLVGLLAWLRRYQQPAEALEAALKLHQQLSRKRAELLPRLKESMQEYELAPSPLRSFFERGTAPPLPPELQV